MWSGMLFLWLFGRAPCDDYGIDLTIDYDQDGNVENGQVLVQLKATDHLKLVAGGELVACRIERVDLRAWLHEPMPVILVVMRRRRRRGFLVVRPGVPAATATVVYPTGVRRT